MAFQGPGKAKENVLGQERAEGAQETERRLMLVEVVGKEELGTKR